MFVKGSTRKYHLRHSFFVLTDFHKNFLRDKNYRNKEIINLPNYIEIKENNSMPDKVVDDLTGLFMERKQRGEALPINVSQFEWGRDKIRRGRRTT